MKSGKSNLERMDNIGIVVESLDETIAFFAELGLKLEGRAMVEGEWDYFHRRPNLCAHNPQTMVTLTARLQLG